MKFREITTFIIFLVLVFSTHTIWKQVWLATYSTEHPRFWKWFLFEQDWLTNVINIFTIILFFVALIWFIYILILGGV